MQVIFLIILVYCVMTVILALARRFIEWLDIENDCFYIALTWILCMFWLDCVMAAVETVLYGAPVINQNDIYPCAIIAGLMTWYFLRED